LNTTKASTPDSTLWLRLDVREGILAAELRQMVANSEETSPDGTPAFVLPVLRPENGAIHIPLAAVRLQGRRLITALEKGKFDDLEERLSQREPQESAPANAERIMSGLLHLFLEDLEVVLRRARVVQSRTQGDVRSLVARLEAEKAAGVADLPALNADLLSVTDVLSAASRSLEAQSYAARWLRRHVGSSDRSLAAELDDLIAAQEQTARRIEFLFQKQRLLEGAAGEGIAMSDMNVTKIFTILWTIFIPGTAIINWYGQNFQFMPELSWYYSLWVQLGTAFLLTVIPVYVVMRTGALR